jgi:hypothetical protein
MTPRQAAASGCRFIGSITGYDICANPGSERYPQCAVVNRPSANGQPSAYQIWIGVIMPTQNCERYNASGQGWKYDCSVWCKSFGFYTGTARQAPNYPSICAKYLGHEPPPEPTQTCGTDCRCLPHAGQGAPFPPAGAGGVAPQVAINMAQLWKQRIDKYWQQEFGRKGLAYRPPMLVQELGILDYDPNTLMIEYDPAILRNVIAATGNFGLVIALAHEESHHVQMLRGSYMSFHPAIGRELDADRLAGSYLRWAEEQGFLRHCDLAAALQATFRVGDRTGVPAFDPQAHGNAAQRIRALMQGYLNGPYPF